MINLSRRPSVAGSVGWFLSALAFSYAAWNAVASYEIRHGPDWEFAEGTRFLIIFDLLYTVFPLVLILSVVALLALRSRYAVHLAVVANVLVLANAIVPFVLAQRAVRGEGLPPLSLPTVESVVALVSALAAISLFLVLPKRGPKPNSGA